MRRATILSRAIAFIIDGYICSLIVFILAFCFSGSKINIHTASDYLTLLQGLFLLIWIFKDIFAGASIGKRICGIYVGNLYEQIKPVSISKLILRNVFVIIWPIEAIVLAKSKDQNRIGDKIFKTTVYKYQRNGIKIKCNNGFINFPFFFVLYFTI